jgi:hypothetical protein
MDEQGRMDQCEAPRWASVGKWVTVRRVCLGIILGVLTASIGAGAASATPRPGRAEPYREVTRSVIVSTAQNMTTSSGQVTGTPIVHGTGSGSQAAGTTPPLCGSGPGSPTSGTTTTVAKNGNIIFTAFTGTVCQSGSTPTSGTYLLTGTFTITGGTGRFADATGGGTLTSKITLHPTPQGSQGPAVSHARGTIDLMHG